MSPDIQSPDLDTRSQLTTLSSFGASLREISNSVRNYFRTPRYVSEQEHYVDNTILIGDYNRASYDVRQFGMDLSPISHRLAAIAFQKAFIALNLNEDNQRHRAHELIEEAIDHLETYPDEGSVEDRTQAYGCIATHYGVIGDFKNSTKYFKELVDIFAREVRASKFHRKKALWSLDKSLDDLAVAAERSGDFEIARSTLRKEVALARVLCRHPDPIPHALIRITALSETLGNTSKAEIYREKLEQYYDGMDGVSNLSVENAIDYYMFPSSERRRAEVKELFAKQDSEEIAVAICRGALRRTCAYRLTTGLRARGELDKAEQILTELAQFAREITDNHTAVQSELLSMLIDFYRENKMYAELEHHQRMRLKLSESVPEMSAQQILILQADLVCTLLLRSKDTEAVTLQREIVKKRRFLISGGIDEHPESLVSLAKAEELNGNYEECENLCREAMSIYQADGSHKDTVGYISIIKTILVSSLRSQGKDEEAATIELPSLEELLEAEDDALDHSSLAERIERCFSNGQEEKAREAMEKLKNRYGSRYESNEIGDYMRGVLLLAEGRLSDESLPPQERITFFRDAYNLLRNSTSRLSGLCLKAMSLATDELCRMSNILGLTKEIRRDFQEYLRELEDIEISMEDTESTETYAYANVLVLQANILLELEQVEQATEMCERAREAERKARVRFG